MTKTQKFVREFLLAMGDQLPDEISPRVAGLNYELFSSLVREEWVEFAQSLLELSVRERRGSEEDRINAWLKVIDAIADLIYVLHNVTNKMGIDLEPFLDEVHRANMTKIGGPVRADGKHLKPEGWKPPNLRPILLSQIEHGKTSQSK